jgi:heterodisulfide reductase subunit A
LSKKPAKGKKAAKMRKPARGRPARRKKPAPGKPADADVAIVLSSSEQDLGRFFDLAALRRHLKANARVGLIRTEPYPLSKGEVDRTGAEIEAAGLRRVVVVGASERLFGKFYRDRFARFGIEPSLVVFADILGQGVTVRKGARKAATATAISLVDIALARVASTGPVTRVEAEIKPACIVFGAGIAGISAATALASRGVKVIMLERASAIGGLLKKLNIVFPSYMPSSEFLKSQAGNLDGESVEILTGVEPVAVRGHVGDYRVELSGGDTVEGGTLIIATGADLLEPEGLFNYGSDERVMTQVAFEKVMKQGENPGSNIIMIQCVGSRNEERPYCSRICCTASIKNAILIKQKFPSSSVTILSRGFAGYAGDLDRARELGVEIIRYSLDRMPVIGDGTVEVYDQISEMDVHVSFDRLVLAVPMLPTETNRALAEMLKIPTDKFGFLVEPRLKVRPEEYAPRGIFIAGSAHWPATITESIVQGYGAASRAFDLIREGTVSRSGLVAEVSQELCRGCGRCEEACRHAAAQLSQDEDGLRKAAVVPIQCVGCGVCVGVCPCGAITLGEMSPEQIDMTIEAVTGVRG